MPTPLRSLCRLAAMLVVSAAHADVTLIAIARFPADARDRSGLAGAMAGALPNDRLGSHGSAIAYAGTRAGGGDRYLMLADRGPGDGIAAFRCRYHVVRIPMPTTISSADSPTPSTVEPVVESTILLSDEHARPLVGISSAIEDAQCPEVRFDPEEIRIGPDGTLFISDEYGPALAAFSPQGRLLRRFSLPARFGVAVRDADPALELPPHNRSGRQANRGLEGLAITPDGARLLAAMQGPLIQDGALDAENRRLGVHVRLLEVSIADGTTRELVYPLANPENGINAIVAINDDEFLLLERDGKAGLDARDKKLIRISTAGATNAAGIDRLPATGLPSGVSPVKKTVFLDLLAPRHGIAGAALAEKFEGLTFGPDLPDGRRTLLVSTDNDFRADQPTVVYIFAVDPDDLAVRPTW